MFFVIDGFVLILVAGVALFIVMIVRSAKRDRDRHEDEVRDEQKRAHEVKSLQVMRTQAVPIICVACDYEFIGPLPELGCPKCHTESFCMLVDDYRAEQKRQQSV